MRIRYYLFVVIAALLAGNLLAQPARTTFQSGDDFSPAVDIRTDAAIIYGVNDSFTTRTENWRRQGYRVQMMTGAAWGGYNDYLEGRFDGHNHTDEGQVDGAGNVIWHHPGVPYMVPSTSFTAYLKSLVHKSIDAGVEAVYLEEPEFWSRAGYSEGFKRAWKVAYKEDWRRPDSSPDAFWRSSKLKYVLYKRALADVFADAKVYAGSRKQSVECYVPTHSLINYSQWGIVSPESSLMDLANCDGYIAQVWTGTARTPNHFAGKNAERTFETAFLEYSSMWNMVAPTGRTVYFLADPVEDDPNHSWNDYRANYERTVAASLLFPGVSHFEVMPWPDRVFKHEYPSGSYSKDANTSMPQAYAAELMRVVNALSEMHQKDVQRLGGSGNEVKVLVSDTMMFQRGNSWGENGPIQFDGFYGLALPLMKAGYRVDCTVLECIMPQDALTTGGVMVMNYEAMKPLAGIYHDRLAAWVKGGGNLLYVGDDSDPFHGVREWWNKDGKTSDTARQRLFATLSAPADVKPGEAWKFGSGKVNWLNVHPAQLARNTTGPETLMKAVASVGGHLKGMDGLAQKNPVFALRRGPFAMGGVLDEGEKSAPFTVKGNWINLFDENAALVTDPVVKPGEVFLLRTADEPAGRYPDILATTARMEETTKSRGAVSYRFRGIGGLKAHSAVIKCASKPQAVDLPPGGDSRWEWDDVHSILRVWFPMPEGGAVVSINQG